MPALDPEAIASAIRSHIAAGGHCQTVTGHEPKVAPAGAGDIAAGVWFGTLGPSPSNSSLSATDVIVVMTARFYLPTLTEPQDEIDPRATRATIDLMSRVTGDFTLGDTCDFVDLLGQHGTPMAAQAGYVEIGRALQRVVDVTIPAVVHDAWSQAR